MFIDIPPPVIGKFKFPEKKEETQKYEQLEMF